MEKEKGLPFAAHMASLDTLPQIAKLQCDFIDYVVSPLWSAVEVLLPNAKVCCLNMKENRAKWKAFTEPTAGEGGGK